MTEALVIPRGLADEMVAHCLAGRPHEACGVLGANNGEIVKVFRATNVERSPMRYALDPDEQLAIYRTLDKNGWDLGAVFHSHTRTEAYPSPTDVRRASETCPYVIVSLMTDPPQVRAFHIVKANWMDAEGTIEEIPVRIV